MKPVRDKIIFVLPLCPLLVFMSCNKNRSAEQIVHIDNGKIKLGFDKNTGAFLVFTDLVNSQELLDTSNINRAKICF